MTTAMVASAAASLRRTLARIELIRWMPLAARLGFSIALAAVQTFYLSKAFAQYGASVRPLILSALFLCLLLALLTVSKLALLATSRARSCSLALLAGGIVLLLSWPAAEPVQTATASRDGQQISLLAEPVREWG